jgi:hypothetical protein
MQKLFDAIDGEPVRKPSVTSGIATRIAAFFSSLSPRTMAWSAGAAALALLLQAGVIGAVLMNAQRPTQFETASFDMRERAPMTRDLSAAVPAPRALVRFAQDAKMADINALLDNYQASIVGGANGLFRLQFSGKAKDDVASLIGKLRSEKIVSLAEAAP